MQQKLQTRAFERVAEVLQTGEQPLVAVRAMVGSFTAGRFGTVATHGIVLAGAGTVGAAMAASAGKQFVVLTDRRFIFLTQTFLGGPGKKILGALPRTDVALVEVTWGMVSLLRLAFAQGDGLSLTFPRSDRKNAESLAAAMGQPRA
ncbi:hypothetical protein ACWKSP_13475 [Micromonosporaceae bacterium Da 78-11]